MSPPPVWPGPPADDAITIDQLVQRIASDSSVNDLLEAFCRDWEERFDSAASDCRSLAHLHDPTYLLDFDVVLSYLHRPSRNVSDALSVDYLISRSHRPYALPLGSFLELIDWLSRLSDLTTRAIEAKGSTHYDSLLERLQDELAGIAGPGDRDQMKHTLVTSLERSSQVMVDRLEKFLLNPRFRGLVSEHDPQEQEIFRELLSHSFRVTRRMPDRRRYQLDKRDAINLTIAAAAYRKARLYAEDTGSAHYILISRTYSVLKLPTYLEEGGQANLLVPLAKLLGLPASNTQRDLQRRFPVVTPFRAMILEKIGFFENTDAAATRARDLVDRSSAALDQLQRLNFIRPKARASTAVAEAFQRYVGVQRKAITSVMDRLIETLRGDDSRFRQMEHFRATESAIAKARGAIDPANPPPLPIRTASAESVLRLLDRVVSRVGEVEGLTYSLIWKSKNTDPVKRFSIEQLGLGAIMWGEVYHNDEVGGRLVVYRWLTDRDEVDLFVCLCSMVAHLAAKSSLNKLQFNPALLEDLNLECWANGLAVTTDAGIVVFPYDLLLDTTRETAESLRSIRDIRRMLSDIISLHDIEIQQYRLNTSIGDFVFDIVPPEDHLNMYCSVISTLDVSELVTTCASKTSLNGAFHAKLAETIRLPFETVFEDANAFPFKEQSRACAVSS